MTLLGQPPGFFCSDPRTNNGNRIFADLGLKASAVDSLSPLADAQQDNIFGKLCDNPSNLRAIQDPIFSPSPIPGNDICASATAAHSAVETFDDFRNDVGAGAL